MEFQRAELAVEPHVLRRKAILKRYRNELKALQGTNPASAVFIVGLCAIQWLLSFALAHTSWVAVAIASYAVGAFVSHALFVLMHEATHNLVFRGNVRNQAIALLGDLAIGLPIAMGFRRYHLLHHRHMGVYDLDADLCSEFEGRLVGDSRIRKAIWLFFFGFAQIFRPLRMAANLRQIDGRMVLNIGLCAAFCLVWAKTVGPLGVMYLWLSTVFCLGLHPLGGRWIAEHYTTTTQETFSYYGPVNRVMFNIGYHTEHHDFANVPWNRLPLLTALAEDFYRGRAHHSSYTRVAVDFIMKRGMTPFSRVVRAKAGRADDAGAAAALRPYFRGT